MKMHAIHFSRLLRTRCINNSNFTYIHNLIALFSPIPNCYAVWTKM
uniref:Uncharacterized protein n=1 Tax=Parascaris equorum TaxID=6256 RepID=A0A914RF85_PAREQ